MSLSCSANKEDSLPSIEASSLNKCNPKSSKSLFDRTLGDATRLPESEFDLLLSKHFLIASSLRDAVLTPRAGPCSASASTCFAGSSCFLKQIKQDSEKVADLEFIRSLKEEHLDEMFTLFARGTRRFYQRGTGNILEPPRAQTFRAAYVAEMDVIQEFINDCCEVTNSGYTKRTLLYDGFQCWWDNSANTGKSMSAKKFYSSLSKKGHRADGKKKGVRVVAGLVIKVSSINI